CARGGSGPTPFDYW
nr:immunoglobulin heavy chain junction region [Mus musculus]